MNTKPFLPPGKQAAYALGQLGWSTLVNIIGLELVFFYLPPENAGLPTLITTVTFLGIFNAITLIAASGRLWDAITDPIIANLSDRSRNPRGRRIPFLAVGALPAALFCTLMFVPLAREISTINIVWLVIAQLLFYLFLTVYVTPFLPCCPSWATRRTSGSTCRRGSPSPMRWASWSQHRRRHWQHSCNRTLA